MAGTRLICDTGPLVAFFSKSDQYHQWAVEQFAHLKPPVLTCDAVISEIVFLLQDDGLSEDPIMQAVSHGMVVTGFAASQHWSDLQRLMRSYRNLPMSFADACLVRMSELAEDTQLLTLDRHFQIYRRNERQRIPLLAPFV